MSNDLNLPWRVELSDTKPGVVGKDGYLIAEAFSSNVSAHIVKCVNAHDALVALLTRYRNETPLGHQPHMTAHEVDAALAKAQGEGK